MPLARLYGRSYIRNNNRNSITRSKIIKPESRHYIFYICEQLLLCYLCNSKRQSEWIWSPNMKHLSSVTIGIILPIPPGPWNNAMLSEQYARSQMPSKNLDICTNIVSSVCPSRIVINRNLWLHHKKFSYQTPAMRLMPEPKTFYPLASP